MQRPLIVQANAYFLLTDGASVSRLRVLSAEVLYHNP